MADNTDLQFNADISFEKITAKIRELKTEIKSLGKIKTTDDGIQSRIQAVKTLKAETNKYAAQQGKNEKKFIRNNEKLISLAQQRKDVEKQIKSNIAAISKQDAKISDREAKLAGYTASTGDLTAGEKRDRQNAQTELANAQQSRAALIEAGKQLQLELNAVNQSIVETTTRQQELTNYAIKYADALERPAELSAEIKADWAKMQAQSQEFVPTEAVGNAEKLDEALEDSAEHAGQVKTEVNEIDTEKLKEQGKKVTEQLTAKKAVPKLAIRLDADTAKMDIAQVTQYLIKLQQAQKLIKKEGVPEEWRGFYNRLVPKIEETKARLKELMAQFKETGSDESTRDLTKNYLRLGQQILPMVTSALNTMSGAIKKVVSGLVNLAKKAISAFKSLSHNISNGITKALDRMKKVMEKAFSTKTLKHNLQTLIKYTFGVRSLFFLWRKLRAAVKEGLENLVQYNSSSNATNKAITELRTSLLYLKNAWAAAFAPIINFVQPWLTSLLDTLATVGNAIARFMAALTGQETVIQAVKTDAGDYADSLKDVGGSAGGAAKKTKQLTDRLAAFDDLNVLGVDKDPNGTGSGGGGGSGNKFTPDVNDMFTRIATPANDLIKKLKEAWASADFTEIGMTISKKLEDALDTAYKWVTGDGKKFVHKIAESINTFLNGFLADPNLGTKIGKTFVAAFELGFDFLNRIITPERMGQIGTLIANALNEASNIIPTIGATIGNIIASAISGFYAFTTTFNYAEFGENIGKAIANFFDKMNAVGKDGKNGWQKLGESLASGVNGLLEAINKAFEALPPEEVGKAIGEFLASIDIDEEQVRILLENLWTAITEAWAGLEKENPDFVSGLLKGLNIFGDIATDIALVVGLLSLVASSLSGLAKLFPILTTLAGIIGADGGVAAGFALMGAKVSAVIALLAPFISVALVVAAVIGGIIETIYALNVAEERGEQHLMGFKDVLFMLSAGAIPAIIYAIEYLKGAFSAFGEGVEAVFNATKLGIKLFIRGTITLINILIAAIELAVNGIIKGVNRISSTLSSVIQHIPGASNITIPTASQIALPRVPMLAQGAVIPPNNEFMAILGDQKSGTNIEAPLDTIKQAVAEVMNGNDERMIQLLQELISVVESKNLVIGDKEIGKANARYVNQQKLIRGTAI